MTILAYQVFYAVVKERSFQKAAESLNLTPSAISHTISSMEKELGFPLFVRSKQGVQLTGYGESLRPYILNVLQSEDSLQEAIAQMNGLEKGTVKIGAFNSICTTLLPQLIKSFREQHPSIEIEVYQGTYDDVLKWIKNGTVDLGFLSISSAGGLPIIPLFKDRLVSVMPKGTNVGGKEFVRMEDLRGKGFVSQRESTDADIQNLLKKYDVEVQSNCHVVDDQSTIAMVESGLGICIMPSLLMSTMRSDVDIYPIEPPEYRVIGICTKKEMIISPAVNSMREHIIKTLKEI
ncbi:MAG: LysR family transcriptional regulator [Anaerostipes sp.]|uniref:LysR family transcriptional regulator n=1 Tax=Anaerostipes sp. 992a TaxID=1261637 RepID=UPI000950E123|nr:LysR family transcriptional regulator [Anaerostipes sp. 992a]MCI5952513.1 LysR family transcriptional regulator [Anaerostipes sp.]MDD5969451.1 LysR family transcriptional regulator [Anaerostipes sp.]OLR63680.1 LysR family transcriptional regulator [Anaerostipes sp. 992a]